MRLDPDRRRAVEPRIKEAHKKRYGTKPADVSWVGWHDAFTHEANKQVHWVIDHFGPRLVLYQGEL